MGGGELRGGEGGRQGADAEVAGEGGASRVEEDEDITICGVSGKPSTRVWEGRTFGTG